jgi:hypothetical protein
MSSRCVVAQGTHHQVGCCQSIPKRSGIGTSQRQQSKMVKSLSALAIFLLLGAAVIVLPGFAPQVEAGETVALAKADRLDIQPVVGNCSGQVWPNFTSSCLRNGEAGGLVREARLVTARR